MRMELLRLGVVGMPSLGLNSPPPMVGDMGGLDIDPRSLVDCPIAVGLSQPGPPPEAEVGVKPTGEMGGGTKPARGASSLCVE
jgi:hypothetical protein